MKEFNQQSFKIQLQQTSSPQIIKLRLRLPGGPTSSLVAASGAEGVETKQQVKHVLSKELQLYFERIANALTNEDSENIRETAIASLRNDPGLHQLVPYLVAFIAEKVCPIDVKLM